MIGYTAPVAVTLAGNTFTAEQVVPSLKVQGVTGATEDTGLVGGTTSGAPVSGTFEVGDYIYDATGAGWFCTVAGTPGTWVPMGSGVELAFAAGTTALTGVTVVTDVPGCSVTFTVGSRPVIVHGFAPSYFNTTADQGVVLTLTDEANTITRTITQYSPIASGNLQANIYERFATPGTYTRKLRVIRAFGAGSVSTISPTQWFVEAITR